MFKIKILSFIILLFGLSLFSRPAAGGGNDGKSQFSWTQIKKLFDKDKRRIRCNEKRWNQLIADYNKNTIGTLKTRINDYATPELIRAMTIIPRPFFAYQYENNVDMTHNSPVWNNIIDIGWGSTMSASSIQAYMTAHLEPKPGDVALEIGTGSGVQAAILSRMVKMVYTIEIRDKLAKRVQKTLKLVGYPNIQTKIGDGYYGWKDKAPFDIIIVTCQANHTPPALVRQLKKGGRMVIPVGQRWSRKQQMLKIWKDNRGRIRSRKLRYTYFVPMLSKVAYDKKGKQKFDYEHKEFKEQVRKKNTVR